MKYIHLVLYRFLNWTIWAFNPLSNWMDTHFPIVTNKETGSTLCGAIGFWMMWRASWLAGTCVKEGTLKHGLRVVRKNGKLKGIIE